PDHYRADYIKNRFELHAQTPHFPSRIISFYMKSLKETKIIKRIHCINRGLSPLRVKAFPFLQHSMHRTALFYFAKIKKAEARCLVPGPPPNIIQLTKYMDRAAVCRCGFPLRPR